MNYCEWHKVHYEPEACPKCALEEWRGNKNAGCMTVILFWPFYMIGALSGWIFGTLRDGFKSGAGVWDDAWKCIRRPKPQKGRVTHEE